MKFEVIQAAVRHFLNGLGVILAGQGWVGQDDLTMITGGLMTVLSFGWSLYNKFSNQKKVDEALKTPAPTQ